MLSRSLWPKNRIEKNENVSEKSVYFRKLFARKPLESHQSCATF